MPRHEGVYQDSRGGWYFKAWFGHDPLTGKKHQVTKRGFRSAGEASRARRALLDDAAAGRVPIPTARASMSVNELMEWYLDGLDADGRLSPKTRFDYRHYNQDYIEPWLGSKSIRSVTPEMVIRWQRTLMAKGGRKKGQSLSAATVRRCRAPLSGAFKAAMAAGIVSTNPVARVPPPTSQRSIPSHWSPEEAREFLRLERDDRMWPVWAFLMGSGLRIGELIALRWPNVDLERRLVRVVEFCSTHGYEVHVSSGKSRDAVRTVDLDPLLVDVLKRQRDLQARESAAAGYSPSDLVFTRLVGGPYHPQTVSQSLRRRSVADGLPRLTAHGLRHTSATLMLANGVPPKVAAERLGHADATLFSNLYSHVTPTMQREAAAKIGAALFGPDPAAHAEPTD